MLLAVTGLAALVLVGCGAGVSQGDLQLVIADQTLENPIRDVVEISVSNGTLLYPESSGGGTPSDAGIWLAGESLTISMWEHAADEDAILWSVDVPVSFTAEQLTLVLEVKDDSVAVSSSALGVTGSFDRHNPAEEARLRKAAAEKEAEIAAAKAAEEAEQETQAEVTRIRDEARIMSSDVDSFMKLFDVVWDEHNTVYGDDNWATFKQIKRKFKDYTSEALGELQPKVPTTRYSTSQVKALKAEWLEWWDNFIDVQSRAETAAGNNDSTAMDSVRADENEIWDQWSEIDEHLKKLVGFTVSDLTP